MDLVFDAARHPRPPAPRRPAGPAGHPVMGDPARSIPDLRAGRQPRRSSHRRRQRQRSCGGRARLPWPRPGRQPQHEIIEVLSASLFRGASHPSTSTGTSETTERAVAAFCGPEAGRAMASSTRVTHGTSDSSPLRETKRTWNRAEIERWRRCRSAIRVCAPLHNIMHDVSQTAGGGGQVLKLTLSTVADLNLIELAMATSKAIAPIVGDNNHTSSW